VTERPSVVARAASKPCAKRSPRHTWLQPRWRCSVRASSAAACLLSERRARVFSTPARSACVHKYERTLHAGAAASAVAAVALGPVQRVGRREDGVRAGGLVLPFVLRCKQNGRLARVSLTLPPLCARIGARHGRTGALRPQSCARRVYNKKLGRRHACHRDLPAPARAASAASVSHAAAARLQHRAIVATPALVDGLYVVRASTDV
jgi:hypothetical protein